MNGTKILYPGTETTGYPVFSRDQVITDINLGPMGGQPPYTYEWYVVLPNTGLYFYPANCGPGATGSITGKNVSCEFATNSSSPLGQYNFQLLVTDSELPLGSRYSVYEPFNLNASLDMLSLTCAPTIGGQCLISGDQVITFNNNTQYGTGGNAYSYSLVNGPAGGTLVSQGHNQFKFSVASNTEPYVVKLTATDQAGETSSQTVDVQVNKTLEISTFACTPNEVGSTCTIPIGQTVTFSNTITGGTGDVAYTYTGTAPGNMTDQGSDTFLFGTVGTYKINLNVQDQSDETNSSTLTIVVTKANPTLATNLDSSTFTVGSVSTTDTATLTGGVTPTGTPTFYVYSGETCTGTPVTQVTGTDFTGGSTSTATIGGLGVGSYEVQAVYSGDTNNQGATSPCGTEQITVNQAQPTLATNLDSSTFTVGSVSTTDTATLTGGVTPTGTPTFYVYSGETCTGTPVTQVTGTDFTGGSTSTATIGGLGVGSYEVQAVYSGDTNNQGATSPCGTEQITVNQAQPTLATNLDSSTFTVGSVSTTDTATLTGGVTPTGTPTFYVYSGETCTGTPVTQVTGTDFTGGSTSTATISGLGVGSYEVQAVYSGDTNNQGATSPCGTEQITVNQAQPTLATNLDSSTFTVGSVSTTDTATLTGGVTPTGTPTFYVYSGETCTGTPVTQVTGTDFTGGSTSTATISGLGVGSYEVQAVYSGDTNNQGATSPCGTEQITVNQAQPTVSTLVSSEGTITIGSSATDTATISGGYNPAGSVTFTAYSDSSCATTPVFTSTVPVSTGTATSGTFTPATAGTYYWQASYSGDGNNNGYTTACGGVAPLEGNGLYAAFWKSSFYGVSPLPTPSYSSTGCVSESTWPEGSASFAGSAPTATEIDPNIAHGTSTGFYWMESPPGSGFSVNGISFTNTEYSTEWTGYIYLTGGTTYYFQLNSDDGSLLYINTASGSSTISGSNLVLNDANTNPTGYGIGIQGASPTNSGAVTVPSSGWYPIEVDYYETCDSQSGIDLSWATGSPSNFAIIPTTAFEPAMLGSNSNEVLHVQAPTTLTTTSSSTGIVSPGTLVTDAAAVAAVPPSAGTPTGTVQFYFCGPTATATPCAISGSNAFGSSVTLSGGSATSPPESEGPTAPGYYCWSAVYTPDNSNFVGSSSTDTTNECFQVVAPTTVTTTSSSAGAVMPGTLVTDSAGVAAVPSDAGTPSGNVQFYFCGPTATATPCNTLGTPFGEPVTLLGGTATSPESEGPTAVGYYCWSAVYTPDTANFIGSQSTTTSNECFQILPPSLTLIKTVTNSYGGTASATEWTLSATGTDTPLSGSTPVTSGSDFLAGTYTLSESNGPSGYSSGSWSCTNGIVVGEGNTITLTNGQSTTCTVNNQDIQPGIYITKIVSDNYGGTATPSSFTMYISGTDPSVTSIPGSSSGTYVYLDAGSYSVTESSLAGYQQVSASEDCSGTISVGEIKYCTITNEGIPANLIIVKNTIGGDGEFGFTTTGSGISPFSITTTSGSGAQSFNGISAGSYSVTETVPEGWQIEGTPHARADRIHLQYPSRTARPCSARSPTRSWERS